MKGLGLTLALAAACLVAPSLAKADASPGECSSGLCGTPKQDGGGGCGCGGGSILIANTDMGKTYSTSDDYDLDGFEDNFDNCPFAANRDQADADGDGVGDTCDNAPAVSNPDQLDTDGNGIGDVIDPDIDGDGILNAADNCKLVYNPSQLATVQGATFGDACNTDDDADGILDVSDPCPKFPGTDTSNPACNGDADADGVPDTIDNCPDLANRDQLRSNPVATLGDACNPDIDGDLIPNVHDNAPLLANPDQRDSDHDGIGDVADSRFCMHYGPSVTEANCLDPQGTFQARGLALDYLTTKSTDPIELKLLANRSDIAIEYSWKITKTPDGSSNAKITNATGKVSVSGGTFEYRYQNSGFVAPKLVPDVAGKYEVTLEAHEVFPDPVWGTVGTSHDVVSVSGGGNESSGGCQSAAGSSIAGLILAAGLLLGRRSK